MSRRLFPALLLGAVLATAPACSLVAGLVKAAARLILPAADVLRRGSDDWETQLARLSGDEDALSDAVDSVLVTVDRPAQPAGAPQAEADETDRLAASRARLWLAKHPRRRARR